MPPKGETCRLVATTKVGADINLCVLCYQEGFVYFQLNDISEQREDIKKYITDLQPKILSGVYHTELVDMEKEEVCC